MQLDVPEAALPYGFINTPIGTHTSRTLMLKELTLVMDAAPDGADRASFRHLVLDENVTLKKTVATRKETFRRLRELYGLEQKMLLFRALQALWGGDPAERPLLALLCATARDPHLRATSRAVIPLSPGTVVTPHMLEQAITEEYPDRYSPITIANIGRHAISSWAQSGHLAGRLKKIRACAVSGPASTAYALLLGHLCGERGVLLFDTFWTHLLDAPPATIDAQAFAAAQRGWIDYRRLGDVAEIGFGKLLARQDDAPDRSRSGDARG